MELTGTRVENNNGLMAIVPEYKEKEWQPEMGESYYYPHLDSITKKFKTCIDDNAGWTLDKAAINRGWAKRTREEAQELCDRLNNAIKDIR